MTSTDFQSLRTLLELLNVADDRLRRFLQGDYRQMHLPIVDESAVDIPGDSIPYRPCGESHKMVFHIFAAPAELHRKLVWECTLILRLPAKRTHRALNCVIVEPRVTLKATHGATQ